MTTPTTPRLCRYAELKSRLPGRLGRRCGYRMMKEFTCESGDGPGEINRCSCVRWLTLGMTMKMDGNGGDWWGKNCTKKSSSERVASRGLSRRPLTLETVKRVDIFEKLTLPFPSYRCTGRTLCSMACQVLERWRLVEIKSWTFPIRTPHLIDLITLSDFHNKVITRHICLISTR